MAADFDRVARAYRWMEYVSLGPMLQRTRMHFVPYLLDRRKALVLGDGDGRFLAGLMRRNTQVRAVAVDTSARMLSLLRERTDAARVTTHQKSALAYLPDGPVDLIATHFFLDCLTQAEVETLARRLAPLLDVDGLWVVSEFRIPKGWMRWPARVYVGLLYRAFGLLTGLPVRRLPDHAAALRGAGLTCVASQRRLFGLLASELWRF